MSEHFLDSAQRANLTRGGIAHESGKEDVWTPDYDPAWKPGRDTIVPPAFKEHPIPPVAQFLWMMARMAPCPPPWRVRVNPKICAAYTMARISLALSPHAVIVMTADGRTPAPLHVPARTIEFNWDDNGVRNPEAEKHFWTPTSERTERTI